MSKITRRQWLKSTVATGIIVCATGGVRARAGRQTPNEKLNIAMIGSGGRGAANLGGVSSENIVALCDVDERRAAGTFQRHPDTPKFADDYSGALTETVLLGNVSYRTGRPIQWDAKSMKALDCPEADPYIRREYREAWTL